MTSRLLLLWVILVSPGVMTQSPCNSLNASCLNQNFFDFLPLFASITEAEAEGLKGVKEEYGEDGVDKLLGRHKENVWTNRMSRLSRHKRAITSDTNKYWPDAIVPYAFNDDVSEESRNEALISMRRHEKYTCIRFVPWVKNQTRWELNLPDEAHMRFVKADACWAFLGNNHSPNGQKISCCGRSYCIHELSHILGVYHSQVSPARSGWITVNWNNIAPRHWGIYAEMDREDVHMFRYDISSNMHYNSLGFREGPWPVMSVLFKDLQPLMDIGGNTFYLWQEIAGTNQCKARHCPDFSLECVNDGFVSYVDGECRCLCPPGLDHRTGCSTVIKKVESATSWPATPFGLLSASDTCPHGFSPLEFQTETRLYDTSENFHLGGNITDEFVNLLLCIKATATEKQEVAWQRGSYCLLAGEGEKCPLDFERHNVDIPEFNLTLCCRDDGFDDDPLNLPTETPFILLPNNFNGPCQSVSGMLSTLELLEMTISRIDLTIHHNVPIKIFGNNHVTLGFCYYTKYNAGCGSEIHLSSSKMSDVITSPGYPGNYSSSLDCYWLIKGPPNSTIVLDFNEFEVGGETSNCDGDYIKVRHAILGQIALKQCGTKLNRSFRSLENVMTLNLHTDLVNNYRGFEATVKVVLPEVHCYNLADKGKSYRGRVNFTADYQPCLPWDQVTSCPHHMFNPSNFDAMLEENYCRNPDDSFRPWCYTKTYEGQCERNYCDVCRLEKVYDVASDCEQLKKEGFCDTQQNNVMSLCARTCNVTLVRREAPSSCGRPPILQDALLTFDRIWHDVGDTVTHRCPYGPDAITRRCHSDGTWSPGNYVCGVCSNDWSSHNGACYKYFSSSLTYRQAEDFCALHNSFLSPANSEEELQFITSLRPKLKRIWLGATRRKTDLEWFSTDDTKLATKQFEKGKDDLTDQSVICAIISPESNNNAFQETKCLSKYHFVCKRSPSPRRGCVNRRWDCHSLLRRKPAMCQEFPDFAWQQCPFTCGVCQPYSTPFCKVPTPGLNVDFDGTRRTYIPRGHVISYTCKTGTVFHGGDLQRACEDTGWLTGNPPTCIDIKETVTPNNHIPLVSRMNRVSQETTYIGNNSLHRIHREGEIVQWSFYASSQGSVCLQVWRPRPDIAPLQFEFVGQNFVTTLANRVNKVNIPFDARIQVQEGDVIGLWAGSTASPITYNECGEQVMAEASNNVIMRKKSASYFELSQVYNFSSPGCRTFSLTAHVNTTWHPYTFTSMIPIEASKFKVDHGGNIAYIIPNSFLTMPVNGRVVEWQLYLQKAGELALQVWRRRPEDGDLAFELVGQTRLSFETNGKHNVYLNGSEQIRVQKGDVTGIWFGLPTAFLSYKTCTTGDISHTEPLVFMRTDFNFAVGNITTFTHSFQSCRIYPLIAILEKIT